MAATLPGITLIPGADGGAAGLLGARTGRRPEQHHAQRTEFRRHRSAARRDDADARDDVQLRSVARRLLRRPDLAAHEQRHELLRRARCIRRSMRRICSTPIAIGRQLGQQFTNLQLSGSAVRADLARQGVLLVLVAARPPLEHLSGSAQHRSARPRARRRIGRLGARGSFTLLGASAFRSRTRRSRARSSTQNGSFLTSFDFSPSGHALVQRHGERAMERPGRDEPVDHGGAGARRPDAQLRRNAAGAATRATSATTSSTRRARRFKTSVSSGDPYIELPSATVRVNSTFADGTAGVSNLLFGGNTGLPRNSNTFNVGAAERAVVDQPRQQAPLQVRPRLPLQPVLAGQHDEPATARTSTTRSPISRTEFRRASRVACRSIAGWATTSAPRRGSGDSYRRTPRFQLTYGLRVDASHFQGNPAFNAGRRLRVRRSATTRCRAACTSARDSGSAGRTAPIRRSAASRARSAARAARSAAASASSRTCRAHSSSPRAVDQTGLPTAAQQLSCIGSAVPVPNWARLPDEHRDDPDDVRRRRVRPSRARCPTSRCSRRTTSRSAAGARNLNWNMPVLGNRFRLTSGATYSLNLNQQGQIDLNFNRIARFTLPDGESSGLRQPDEHLPDHRRHHLARRARHAELRAGHRLHVRSPVAQHAGQPRLLADRASTRRSSGTRRTSGRRSSTRRAASAAARRPAIRTSPSGRRGDRDARHQITYNVGYTFHQAVSVTAFGRFQSGNPFTPIGLRRRQRRRLQQRSRVHLQPGRDGRSDSCARGMQNLLANAPSSVRDCLRKQLGTIAGKNSCEGPWSTQLEPRASRSSRRR